MKTNKPNGTGLSRLAKATKCSIQGFIFAWKFESAFRQETILAIALLPISFVIAQSYLHWYFLIASLLFLIFAELINSALEALADRITLEHDLAIKRAKDIGSSGVFIALTLVVIVWGHAAWLTISSYLNS